MNTRLIFRGAWVVAAEKHLMSVDDLQRHSQRFRIRNRPPLFVIPSKRDPQGGEYAERDPEDANRDDAVSGNSPKDFKFPILNFKFKII
jgi:hypothetical protein